ncbi:MAG: hypothetical protein ACI9EV_002716, partial [Urechidicola sp.]
MIIEKIKAYFKKKADGVETASSPEGTCPTCWGRSEWDGKYYDVVKDKHLHPEVDTYSHFISKVVDQHVATTRKHEDT